MEYFSFLLFEWIHDIKVNNIHRYYYIWWLEKISNFLSNKVVIERWILTFEKIEVFLVEMNQFCRENVLGIFYFREMATKHAKIIIYW